MQSVISIIIMLSYVSPVIKVAHIKSGKQHLWLEMFITSTCNSVLHCHFVFIY